jgi:predicted transcriptional regulator
LKYRSRTEIIALILATATNGATKTRMMYGAYLSYTQIVEYLKLLQVKGLLVYEEGTQQYKLTEKGLHFLDVYEKISEVLTVTKTTSTDIVQPEAKLAVAASSVREW